MGCPYEYWTNQHTDSLDHDDEEDEIQEYDHWQDVGEQAYEDEKDYRLNG
jgi:hypothetical protein